MWRAAIAGLIWTAVAAAQNDKDIERWLSGPAHADIRWSTHISPASLSRFQRLAVRFSIRADGREIEQRRGKGALLMMVELRDASGKRYESHRTIDLREPPHTAATHLNYSEWSVAAFLTPGDYQVTFAMADLNAGEHNLARQKLHIAPLAGDPLPGAWRDLLPVEFIQSTEPPDAWFVPESTARLVLPVAAKRPVRVEVVVNTSVSETSRIVQRRQQQSIGALVGALKVLGQLDVRDGRLNISLLDVTRRRTIFTQDSVTGLDWLRLKTALGADDRSTIDVGALKDRDQDIQFFLHEIAGRIAKPEGAAAGDLRVVIVLSPPMAFPAGVDRTPSEPPADPDFRVYYIRYQTFAGRPSFTPPMYSASAGRPSPLETERLPHGGVTHPGLPDQLAQPVKPLHPRLFDVFTPLDFRNAIAAILREISTVN
jgi:hypothetical protein